MSFPTIVLAIQAASNSIRLRQTTEYPASILHALDRNDAAVDPGAVAGTQRHPERVTRQGTGEALPPRPTHNLAGV